MAKDNGMTHLRMLHFTLGVVLLVTTAFGAEKAPKPAKPPKPPPPPKAHPNTGPGGGPAAPKRPIDQQIERLAQMSPAQRERALSNLPPERRAKVEAGIERWNNTSPELKAEAEKLRTLPPEQQKRIRQLSQRIRSLPPERRVAVRQELRRLRNMPADRREKRLNSPAVRNNFSPEEQDILRESPALLPPNFL